MRRGALLLILLLSCAPKEQSCSHIVQSDIEPLASPPDAAAFLRQVETRYRQLASYADTGCVLTSFGGRIPHHNRKPFETTFARPSTFRFEYTDTQFRLLTGRFVAWTDKGKAWTWWSVRPKLESFPTIPDALMGYGAVSGGSSYTIPRLLLPEIHGSWITRLPKARVLGTQRLPSGTVCYVIEGEDRLGPVRLWVERDTLAIRRIHNAYELPSGTHVDTTTTYQPRFNPKIDPSRIPFEPPSVTRLSRLKSSGRELLCRCE